MIYLTIFLANWGIGTLLIGIFALVCVALTIIVLSFVLGGKRKDKEEEPFPLEKKENLTE